MRRSAAAPALRALGAPTGASPDTRLTSREACAVRPLTNYVHPCRCVRHTARAMPQAQPGRPHHSRRRLEASFLETPRAAASLQRRRDWQTSRSHRATASHATAAATPQVFKPCARDEGAPGPHAERRSGCCTCRPPRHQLHWVASSPQLTGTPHATHATSTRRCPLPDTHTPTPTPTHIHTNTPTPTFSSGLAVCAARPNFSVDARRRTAESATRQKTKTPRPPNHGCTHSQTKYQYVCRVDAPAGTSRRFY